MTQMTKQPRRKYGSRKTEIPTASEDDIQKSVVAWLVIQENLGRLTFFAVPNEGRRSWGQINRYKAMGLRAGVPDIIIVTRDGTRFLELKAEDGRMKDSQKDFFSRLETHGHEPWLARSLEEVQGFVNAWCPQ